MKKILILILLLVIALLFFNNTHKKSLKIGMECNYAPFNYSQIDNKNGAVKIDDINYCNGYDVSIAKKIAKDLNLELEIIKISWNGLQPALESGEIDAIIAGMSKTVEREKSADFTTPYYDSELVLVIRKGDPNSNAKDIQEFKGRKIVGQLSTSYDEVIDQIQGVIHVQAKDNYPLMIVALKKHEVDAITAELPVAIGIVEANQDLEYVMFDKGFEIDTAVSIAIKKNNKKLLNDIQNSLDKISVEERTKLMIDATKNQPSLENKMPENFFLRSFEILKRYYPILIKGLFLTLILSLIGTLIGLLIGLLFAIIKNINNQKNKNVFTKIIKNSLKLLVNAYVAIFRGTPMIVQAMFLYFGLKPIIHWNNIQAAIAIISINTGAYMVEIIRSGIQSISKGQKEAAQCLGLNHLETMKYIILPQAIKNSFPSICNEFIVNIKDSAVLSVIGIGDLYFQANSVAGSVFLYSETFFVVAIIYFIVTYIVARILSLIEFRINHRKISLFKSQTSPEGEIS